MLIVLTDCTKKFFSILKFEFERTLVLIGSVTNYKNQNITQVTAQKHAFSFVYN